MSNEIALPTQGSCRLQRLATRGADGAFSLTYVQHDARQFAPHFFANYAVGVVESGACRLTTPHGSWVVTPGSTLVFAPDEPHWAHVVSADPYTYRMAYLSDDCARSLGVWRGERGTAASHAFVPVLNASTFSTTFSAAHRDILEDPDRTSAERRLLSCTRTVLREAIGAATRTHATRDLFLVETAKALLESHIGRRIALDLVASACGVTPFHLIRVFRRVTGLSPYAYLIVLRVNEARRLLDGGASVSDAVYSCGFSDQSHLTRIFKRTIGMPPGLYLRSSAAAAARN